MKKVLEVQDPRQRQELFRHVKQELILHADSEHEQVLELLDDLTNMSLEDESWIEKFQQLQEAVTHHVNEEEEKIFNMAEDILSEEQAAELASDMETEKERINDEISKPERLIENQENRPAAGT